MSLEETQPFTPSRHMLKRANRLHWRSSAVPERIELLLLPGSKRVGLPLGDPVTIGREGNIDLSAVDLYSLGISRRHARICIGGRTMCIEDLHSTNGTYINGLRMMPNTLYPLCNGDVLVLGALIIIPQFQN